MAGKLYISSQANKSLFDDTAKYPKVEHSIVELTSTPNIPILARVEDAFTAKPLMLTAKPGVEDAFRIVIQDNLVSLRKQTSEEILARVKAGPEVDESQSKSRFHGPGRWLREATDHASAALISVVSLWPKLRA